MEPVILVDSSNFIDFPNGGILNFSKQLLSVYGNKLYLVGSVTDDTPLRKWVKKYINGVEYNYFAITRYKQLNKKPLIPPRLIEYLSLKNTKNNILSIGAKSIILQNHQALMAMHNWGWENLCYIFHGTENPMSISRYRWARLISKFFDSKVFSSLQNANLILATSDDEGINKMLYRANNTILKDKIIKFPTRVNTSIFYPMSKIDCRQKLGLPEKSIIFVTCGRLHWSKGWQLLIDAFHMFHERNKHSYLIFVGDGHDREALLKYADIKSLSDYIIITGVQPQCDVVMYLNASDVYVSGSYSEGWPTVLIEAMSCCLPIITTKVSGSYEIVKNGINGFVIEQRSTELYAKAMHEALNLEDVKSFSLVESEKYSLNYLKRDLSLIFSPLNS